MKHVRSRDGMAIRVQLFMIFSVGVGIINLSSAQDGGVCTSEECNRTVAGIFENMDQSVEPCDNFYQYICGEYGKDRELPEHGDGIAIVTDLGDNIPIFIQSFLENNGDEEQNAPYWQAFKIYDQCTDLDTLREQGVDPLRGNIEELGGWPLVEGDQWEEKSWESASEKLAELGYDAGIFFDVDMMRRRQGQRVQVEVQLAPAAHFQISSETWDQLMNVAKRLGADADQLPSIDSMEPFNSLQHHRVKLSSFEHVTVDEMAVRWPSVDWMTFLTGVFASTPDITIDGSTVVAVIPHYTGEIDQLRERASASDIMNYVVASAVESSLPYLSPDVTTDPDADSDAEQDDAARQKYCADLTTQELPSIVEAIFAVNHVDDNLYQDIMNLGDDLRNEMIDIIKSTEWLDDGTIEKCEKKLNALIFQIGYQDALKDGFYTQDYENLELDNDDLLNNVLSIHQVHTNLMYKKSSEKKPAKVDDKIKVPMTAMNCQYHPSSNTVDIMPGILQDPLVNRELPDYATYSGIGFIMGHEITHGYDMEGKVFGRARRTNREREQAKKEYHQRTECIARHYHNYLAEHENERVDGHQTEKENIADAVGVKIAHMAWQNLIKKNGPEPTLAGLNNTLEQTYWISFAKNKCGRYNPEKFDKMVKRAIHGIHEYRTNGPLADYSAFGEAFNCPLGSAMNPVKKCVVF